MGDKVDFLPADNHKRFLPNDTVTLGVRIQTGPKYQKQPVSNICAISQRKHEEWSWFLLVDKFWRFFRIDTIILYVCDQAYPSYLK